MIMRKFNLSIIDNENGYYLINITDGEENDTLVSFNPINKDLIFFQDNYLAEYLKRNEYQFRKLLHNKRPDTFFKGFNLNFVLIDEKDVAAFNDKTKIIVVDKRNGKDNCYVLTEGEKEIDILYTDGSFLEKRGQGAVAILIKNKKGNYRLITEKVKVKNSSLIELIAVIKGLEILKEEEKIRIVTDSQYVRKGLTEWIYYWKLNNWYTANGKKVKHIDYWQRCENLLKDKYIEFVWVKGHGENFENVLCDLYARETAKK